MQGNRVAKGGKGGQRVAKGGKGKQSGVTGGKHVKGPQGPKEGKWGHRGVQTASSKAAKASALITSAHLYE